MLGFMNTYFSSHGAKIRARAGSFFRKREAMVPVDGKPGIRMPPHDGVTLLRAAICLSIVVAHLQPGGPTAWPPFLPFQRSAGWVVSHPRLGFESFFVLAGYFLAHSFRSGPWQMFSVFGFYRRRLVRLLLPYWLILAISWIGTSVYAIHHHRAFTWSPPGFWRQILLMHNLEVTNLVAPQLWFMAPLIQFYFVWGIVFWLVRKAHVGIYSKDRHPATIQAMMVVTAVTFLGSIFMDVYRNGLDFTLFTNAHYLALGCLIYWYTNTRVGIAWVVGALGMEVASGLATSQSRPIAAAVAGLLLAYSADRSYSAGPNLALPMLIGRCSYSIYLTHMFVGWRSIALFLIVLGNRARFPGSTAVTWMVGVIGCVLTGYVFHRCIEQPCARWARKIQYRYLVDTPHHLVSQTLVPFITREAPGDLSDSGIGAHTAREGEDYVQVRRLV